MKATGLSFHRNLPPGGVTNLLLLMALNPVPPPPIQPVTARAIRFANIQPVISNMTCWLSSIWQNPWIPWKQMSCWEVHAFQPCKSCRGLVQAAIVLPTARLHPLSIPARLDASISGTNLFCRCQLLAISCRFTNIPDCKPAK